MKWISRLQGIAIGSLALAVSTVETRGNVYATDIQINGGFGAVTNSSATITYRLNQPATAGCTVSILNSNNTAVATIPGGTSMGLNTVVWNSVSNASRIPAAGTYTVSVTARATGFANWTQISVDTNSGMTVIYPLGIDVDKNTNSPYYGRVVTGNSILSTRTNFPTQANQIGLFKMNADGSQADEGWYGNANYLEDDSGDPPTAGQMPNAGGYNPMKIRIGEDDRIYWCDDSYLGAVVACDMRATTNQMVINESGYANNPDFGDLDLGIESFDVIIHSQDYSSATLGGNYYGAVFLCDADYPNWGIWAYHLVNGAADPADTVGTQAVATGHDLAFGSTGGCWVDSNLDIFVGEYLTNTPAYDEMEFSRWNSGVLPPEGQGATYALGTSNGQVAWGYGCGVGTACTNNPTFTAALDTVANSRTQPTILACPSGSGGIRLFSAPSGAVLQTNIDWGNLYTAAAFDNVGNLYGCSSTLNLWRVWSPPGSNQATTTAIGKIVVPVYLAVTNITARPNGGRCEIVNINFTAPGNPALSSFILLGSTNVRGPYQPVPSGPVTGSAGAYQVSTTNCSALEFYRIEEQ